MKTKPTYIAFLRGINVGGHHKVPMAQLRIEMEKLGFQKVETLLNSGNIIFDSNQNDPETKIADHLEKVFGFSVPTVVVHANAILDLLSNNPFGNIEVTDDTRLYVSFLWTNTESKLKLPWESEEGSFRIIEKKQNMIFSVLDVSVTGTPKAMEALESFFGKSLTTRNWKTIERIGKKLEKR